MAVVSVLINKLASLFIIMAGGFLLTRSGLIKKEQTRVLTVVTVNLITPCAIFNSFLVQWTREMQSELCLSLGAGIVLNVALIALGYLLRRPLKLSTNEQAALSYPNSFNVIVPIITALLGPEYVIYASPFMVVQTILVWTQGKRMICGEQGIDLKKIFCNVQMGAIALGIIVLLTQLKLPQPLSDAISSTGSMVGAISVIITGMIIGGMDLKQVFGNKRVYLTAALRLLVGPAAALALVKLTGAERILPNGHMILLVSLLATMAPSASVLQQQAQLYDREPEYAGAINVVTMLFCILSMPLCVLIYEMI